MKLISKGCILSNKYEGHEMFDYKSIFTSKILETVLKILASYDFFFGQSMTQNFKKIVLGFIVCTGGR